MPQYLTDLRDEVITLIGDTWPEVKPEGHGIYRTREILRKDFEKKTMPVCVLDMDASPWEDRPLNARMDMVRTMIHYVAGADMDGDELMERIEALRTALDPEDSSEPLANGQVWGYPTVSDTAELTVNRYFLLRGWSMFAGVVLADILTGVTA